MQIRFVETKRMTDGYIATTHPIAYTTVAADAAVTHIDIHSFTATDIVNAFINPLTEILKECDEFDITMYLDDVDTTGVGTNVATIRITDCDLYGTCTSADPDTERKIRHLSSDLSMYHYELIDVFTIAKKSAKPVTASVAAASTPSGAIPTSDEEEELEALIQEIRNRTKADVVKPKETLADYVCDSTLRAELEEIRDFMEKEADFKAKGISTPKGILLKGAPGTGKTYAARCVAGTVDCYFLICTASSLQGQYIGSGAQNVRDLFKGATLLRDKSKKGVIVFIDELDSFGDRAHRGGGSSGEEDRTLNQLLAELSGFEDSEGILVMGATNYPERLDDALMRSGRFSRQITIRKPETPERLHMVEYYFSKVKMPLKGTDYGEVSELTKGLTPADIKEITNESAILAMRLSKPEITIDEVNEAVNKVITKNIRTPDGKLDTFLVATHEAGHVLAEYIYNNNIAIKVTNYSYGDAGGFTQPSEHLEGLFTSGRMLNEVRTLLAGRAAEEVLCDKVTNGASNDIEKAKRILKTYYTTYLFEKYDVKELDQLIQDKLLEIYNEVVVDFKAPETLKMLYQISGQLDARRVLYTKDLAPILLPKTGGFII